VRPRRVACRGGGVGMRPRRHDRRRIGRNVGDVARCRTRCWRRAVSGAMSIMSRDDGITRRLMCGVLFDDE